MPPPSPYRLTLNSGKADRHSRSARCRNATHCERDNQLETDRGIEVTDEMIDAGLAELTAGVVIRESALSSSQGHRAQVSTLRSLSELWLTIFRTSLCRPHIPNGIRKTPLRCKNSVFSHGRLRDEHFPEENKVPSRSAVFVLIGGIQLPTGSG